MTASYDFSVLAPPGFLAIGALAVLLCEVLLTGVLDRGERDDAERAAGEVRIGLLLTGLASAAILLAVYAALFKLTLGAAEVFNPARPMLRLDSYSSLAVAIVGTGSLLSVWLSATYLQALRIHRGEYYALLLLSTCGMVILVSSIDMIGLFMGLELMSIPLYALADFDRRRRESNESALAYFLTGAFAGALLLYGMALLYGATGHTGFAGIRAGFAAAGPLAPLGLAFVVAGLAFKVSAAPFHQWTPDVYEGAPTSIAAFVSVTAKTAAFAILLRFLELGVPEAVPGLAGALAGLAVLTMLIGALMAIVQTSVKRLLAYSCIAHAGYLLIGFAVGTRDAQAAVLFYLVVYMFMNLGAFAVVLALASQGGESERIEDFSGLARGHPVLAAVMTLFLISLAGVPGTAGFAAKFAVLSAAVASGEIGLAIVGVLTSVLALVAYVRIPLAMYTGEERAAAGREPSTGEALVLLLCAIAVVYLGILPDTAPFIQAAHSLALD